MDNKIKMLRDWGCDIDGAFERFLNDKNLYYECLLMFVKDENIVAIDKEINNSDVQVPFAIVHSLKGVAGNLGLTPLYESLVILCESLRNNQYDSKSGYYVKVKADLDKFLTIMN